MITVELRYGVSTTVDAIADTLHRAVNQGATLRVDAGGLGAAHISELQRRFGFPIEASQKVRQDIVLGIIRPYLPRHATGESLVLGTRALMNAFDDAQIDAGQLLRGLRVLTGGAS